MDQELDGEDVSPRPAALIEALRSLGYGIETAISDLLDNSISAGANAITIRFTWAGSLSCVSIIDNGWGMNTSELVEAMRPGTLGPDAARASTDLGRFGLGLKTASFSQCRRLTVFSKKKNQSLVARAWDLDATANSSAWKLSTLTSDIAAGAAHQLNTFASGTCVVWEKLDRLVGRVDESDEQAHRAFLEAADRVRDHLSIVFGDFLDGSNGIKIHVGRDAVKKWDPFLRNHDATQVLPLQTLRLNGNEVQVQPFVVPHHSKLSKEEFRVAAGPRGWNAHQGFYVYRNRRLLVAGGWLGLGFTREEHLKLARIRIDLGSGSDFDWGLDVRKSKADPPVGLREPLRRVARLTRERAMEVYRHRGRRLTLGTAGDLVALWEARVMRGKTSFRINREHPIVRSILLGSEGRSLEAVLRLIEESVPRSAIFINHAEAPESQPAPFEGASDKELTALIRELYLTLIGSGRSAAQALATLATMESFKGRPHVLAALAEHPPELERLED